MEFYFHAAPTRWCCSSWDRLPPLHGSRCLIESSCINHDAFVPILRQCHAELRRAIGKTIEFYGFSVFHDSMFLFTCYVKKKGLFLPKCYSCLVNNTCRLKNLFWPTDLYQAWPNVKVTSAVGPSDLWLCSTYYKFSLRRMYVLLSSCSKEVWKYISK